MKTSARIDELIEDLARRSISRREFGKRLTALGLTSSAVAAVLASSDVRRVAAQDKPFSGKTIRVQFCKRRSIGLNPAA